ncbi:hypothetical protein [Enterobacter hormaechei]|uniref:hypothetical protein n=1 Tax=Enterobacter hormaechei TaxID=158836 RepID=UPI00388D3E8A
MSTITKESIADTIEGLEHLANSGIQSVYIDMAIAGMRRLLASLEAEPVAYIFKHPAGRLFWSLTDESNKGQSDVMPVYTAQPAPVFVPDELTREEYKRRFMEDDDFDDTFRGGWKAHRAAMLQGADGNSPVIPDGYALVPVEPTHEMLEAGDEQFGTYDVYRRMIAAAPQQGGK